MKKPKIPTRGDEMRKLGKKWIERVEAAGKFEKNWQDDAQKAQDAYTGYSTDTKDGSVTKATNAYDFNILFANVETIVPAVINSPPVPDIRRRFGETDPAAKTVAQIIERAIQVQIDDSRLQIELEASAQDAFLAGRGVTRIRFRSDIIGEPTNDAIEDAAERVEGGSGVHADPLYGMPEDSDEFEDAAEGIAPVGSVAGVDDNGGAPLERVENERLTTEAVPWIDYRHGPAKRWDERPWDAFRFCIPQEEVEGGFFDDGLINTQINEEERKKRTSAEGELTGWEIWDKPKRRVLFIDDNGVILKIVPDPLGLTGFFCVPTPMQPIEVNGRLTPVNPFAVYSGLADKLDRAVRRKDRLIEGMKAKGWYAGSAKDMSSIIDKEDNEWVPFEDLDALAAAGGLDKAILFWPVEKFIVVIQQLDAAISQYKQWIYEITGISDIIRGASVASETATAQNIKSQWGSLRIQKMQRMMERTARELFIMMSEIIPAKFTLQALEDMTGIPIVPKPGAEEPEVTEQKQAVIELMKRPLSRFYRIDVESDSTIRADLSRQKQELASFLQGAAAYFSAVGPLVKEGTMPADAAAEIFAANARMFNLGRSVEDTLEGMISKAKEMAGQPPPDPRQEAEQRKQAEEAAKAEAANAKTMADGQKAQADAAKTAAEAEKIAADAEATRQQTEARYAEAARKAEADGIEAEQQAIIDALTRDIKEIELDRARIDRDKAQIELEKAQVGLDGQRFEAVTKPIIEAHTATMEIV